ncbi:MAG TPA: porin [Pirellulales bacterium]|nr:porin [Pirellulales bacterium]
MRLSPACAALVAAALCSALSSAAGQTVSTPRPPARGAVPPAGSVSESSDVPTAAAGDGNSGDKPRLSVAARQAEHRPPPNIRSLIEEETPEQEESPEQEGYNRRLMETEAELRNLRQRLQSGAISGGILFPGRDPNSYQPFAPRISGPGAGPETFPHVSVSGFFQADTGFFNQDAASVATFGHIQNGADFRRARLIMLGSAAENLNYLMEMDFAQAGHPTFRDVWAEVDDLPILGTVRAGYFKAPFSLDELTSARQLTFLERSPVTNAFAPFRRMGVAAFNHNEAATATWAGSVSRTLTDTYGGDIGSSGGFAGTGRLTVLPYYDEPSGGRYYLHLGVSYEIAYPGNNTFSFRTIPGVFIGSQQTGGATGNSGVTLPGPLNGVPFFVDTGKITTQDFSLYGAEAAGSWGSLNIQAEWMATTVNQIHNPAVFMQGAYIQGSYFLTGEHRPYIRPSGTIGSIKPIENFFILGRGRGSGWGAWEVAQRVSWLDLDDKNIKGGRMIDYTAGLNWHLHAHVKLQFNYIMAWVNNPVHGHSETNMFATRLQGQF